MPIGANTLTFYGGGTSKHLTLRAYLRYLNYRDGGLGVLLLPSWYVRCHGIIQNVAFFAGVQAQAYRRIDPWSLFVTIYVRYHSCKFW